MGLLDKLYSKEDVALREVWEKMPFALFNPDMRLLGFKALTGAIGRDDREFLPNQIRNNFFPDKTLEQAVEAKMHAINRGINSLNDLCRAYLNIPDFAVWTHFVIPDLQQPFEPLEFMSEAREKWLNGRRKGHRHNPYDSRLVFEAYNAVRCWGLGHMVLMIDESPEVFHSVYYRQLLKKWLQDLLGFKNNARISENSFSWETNARVRVLGTETQPFRERAKIHDEQGNIRYGSIFMKMFLKGEYMEQVYDNSGVELLVEDERDLNKLIDFFRENVKGTTSLEKFDSIHKTEPPEFHCYKFILRAPVRVAEPKIPSSDEPKRDSTATVKEPLKKYIRLPIEVQIRAESETYDHALYKQKQYMRVFPLWYPREIYAPYLGSVTRLTDLI